MKRILALPVVLVACAVAGIVIASLLMVAYPGSFRWTAPVLCPSDQPDAFVVRYSESTSDGQSTNFTLFCMDERGELTEVGSWRPLGLLVAGVTASLFGLIVLVTFPGLLRRSILRGRSLGDAGPSMTQHWSVAGIPDETRIEAQALINGGKMIHAIKKIREDTGMDLKDAKELAEALRDGHPPVPASGSRLATQPVSDL